MGLNTPSAPSFKSKNKMKRHNTYLKHKRTIESAKRDDRFRRKREEDLNPRLRVERRTRNVPITIDRKRVWDEVDMDHGDGIGLSVDLGLAKRQRLDASPSPGTGVLSESNLKQVEANSQQKRPTRPAVGFQRELSSEHRDSIDGASAAQNDLANDLASIIDDSSDEVESDLQDSKYPGVERNSLATMENQSNPRRATSPANSTASTNLSLIPDALASKFPNLFDTTSRPPKILITTNIHGTVHNEAELLTTLLPNSHYVPRTRHRYSSHHFSLREIAKYAANRSYTSLLVLTEDHKRPSGLTVIHLPEGPTFHFTITNWVEGKKLPGHGNPTDHHPELILNNFRTPLGLLTASLFRTLFPSEPEIQGRQVVTLHNQRDYIFVRRHRYVFRDRRATEKAVTGADGKGVQGAEEIRAGLQELGPRFTLKLRRVDKGIQRASGQEWEWKTRMEKQRTKFQL